MIDSLANGIQRLLFLAAEGFVVPGGTPPPVEGGAAAQVTQYAGQAAQAAEQGGGLPSILMIVVWVAMFGGIWFLMMRPQKKREKKLKELQASIKAGDNVVTNGGMFGKVADVGTDCFVVEMGISGRTVKVPILKSDVLGVREPVLTPPPKEAVE